MQKNYGNVLVIVKVKKKDIYLKQIFLKNLLVPQIVNPFSETSRLGKETKHIRMDEHYIFFIAIRDVIFLKSGN